MMQLGIGLSLTSPFMGAGSDVSVTLTTTSMETSVTDPLTGHVYSFVAADGTTPEPREVGQYQDGTWFALGGTGNPVRVGSITPVSDLVSTAAYNEPDNLDDEASTGTRMRARHGAMINPGQGRVSPGAADMGFESFYSVYGTGGESSYDHSLNVDPGATGSPISSEECTIVKAESLLTEGGHTNSAEDKTRILKFSTLTIVPEIPAANSFRPSPRHTDKKSYWTTDQIDISGRMKISGYTPQTTTAIDNANDLIKYVQQTFYTHQEPSRRWNPGARGGGVGVYGDEWYNGFSAFFACFHGDYDDADILPITKSVIQVGIDIGGVFADGDFIFPSQAHHAGRMGIVFAAGKLLNDATLLSLCDTDTYPDNFGMESSYYGYVTAEMVGVQPAYYKGAHPYPWETPHLNLPEWSAVFYDNNEGNVATEEQVADSDIARRSYQVLSVDNGMMYQTLWCMIQDPTADYFKEAYFNFTDRYLGIRFGDQIDGVWDASSDATGTNNHFTGNWWSINPSDTTVANFKEMRDASTRPSYVPSLIPEALPKPQVTHTGSNGYLEVDFNTNNFRFPQNKDAAITGYELRWTTYAGGADTVSGEDQPEYIGNFDWTVITGITSFPYNLYGVPRNEKVKIQIRMVNINGDGPWMDDRKRENYAEDSLVFSALSGIQRYSTNFDVPDIAAFDTVPLNYAAPTVSPSSVVTGGVLTAGTGIWTATPAISATDYQWQKSDDGATGWSDISGATSSTFTTTATEEGKYIRVGVSQTNSEGSSSYVYAETGVLSVAPTVNIGDLFYGAAANTHNPGFGALGGKRLLIMAAMRENGVLAATGGSIGSDTFSASDLVYSRNIAGSGGGREKAFAWIVEVTGGETSETITLDHTDASNETGIVVFELTTAMTFSAGTFGQNSDTSASVATVAGGAAFFFGRGSTSITFNSSPDFTEHSGNVTNAAAAYALSTSAGTATLDVSTGGGSNSGYQIISLAPPA